MNTELTPQGWRVSSVVAGYRVSRLYIGYTEKQAKAAFKQEFPL